MKIKSLTSVASILLLIQSKLKARADLFEFTVFSMIFSLLSSVMVFNELRFSFVFSSSALRLSSVFSFRSLILLTSSAVT